MAFPHLGGISESVEGLVQFPEVLGVDAVIEGTGAAAAAATAPVEGEVVVAPKVLNAADGSVDTTTEDEDPQMIVCNKNEQPVLISDLRGYT